MKTEIKGISSMATRQLLAELVAAYQQLAGVQVSIESVGGVDVARRVQAGEAFDFVVLASEAIDKLVATGHIDAHSKTDLVHSGVAVAVRAGSAHPDIGSEDALRRAVQAARSLGYSTGPSGVALARLFERWGIAQEIKGRIVQAPPGVPVGALVARGDAELGFQQLSELIHIDGIDVLGPLPAAVQISTTFTAGLCPGSQQAAAVRGLLDFMASAATAEAKQGQGMEPA